MPELTLRRIPFTTESDNRLRMLKARTGLDRNYLCRIGFCLSLEEPGIPTVPAEKGREIEQYTLLGQHSRAYIALLLVWMKDRRGELPGDRALDSAFVAHMNRGIELLASRVRSLSDIAALLPKRAGTAS